MESTSGPSDWARAVIPSGYGRLSEAWATCQNILRSWRDFVGGSVQATPFQAPDWESIRRIRARKANRQRSIRQPTSQPQRTQRLSTSTPQLFLSCLLHMPHVAAAARPQVISSGGLPQVRHTPRAEQAGSTTHPRALSVCGRHLSTPSLPPVPRFLSCLLHMPHVAAAARLQGTEPDRVIRPSVEPLEPMMLHRAKFIIKIWHYWRRSIRVW